MAVAASEVDDRVGVEVELAINDGVRVGVVLAATVAVTEADLVGVAEGLGVRLGEVVAVDVKLGPIVGVRVGEGGGTVAVAAVVAVGTGLTTPARRTICRTSPTCPSMSRNRTEIRASPRGNMRAEPTVAQN